MFGQYMFDTNPNTLSSASEQKPQSSKTIPQRPLRIAVVSDAAPHRNGVGAYYQDLDQHFHDHGKDQLKIISPTIENGRWKGGLIFPLPGDNTQKFLMPNPFALRRQLTQYKPDVVIIPTPGLYGVFGAMIAKHLKLKVIVGFHTWYEKLTALYWDHWQEWITRGYFRVSNKILFRYSDFVVVNSDLMVDAAKKEGASNIEIVGTPVSYEFIHTSVKPHQGQLKTIFFAGRLAAEKNLEAIIEAAKTHPQLEFTIAGDGPEKQKILEAESQLNNLNYLGWLDRAELLATIDKQDMLILPSHVESFGTVALEAMARERLVLVSSDCGIAQWQHLNHGLLCINKNETLALALDRIQKDSAESRQGVARVARNLAVELNSWSLLRWREMFDKALMDNESNS